MQSDIPVKKLKKRSTSSWNKHEAIWLSYLIEKKTEKRRKYNEAETTGRSEPFRNEKSS